MQFFEILTILTFFGTLLAFNPDETKSRIP